jgi:SAM-dependent methyltransferase
MKACAFCSGETRAAFERGGRVFLRCKGCGGYTVEEPPTPESWEQYEGGEFAERIEEGLGVTPDLATWDEFLPYMKGKKVLEIGPGTGHLLAAGKSRGFEVTGVEVSPAHRAYMREKWGIEAREEMAGLPEASFSTVLSVNCFEHIADVQAHLTEVRRVMEPGGRFIISTCNGGALVPRLVGKWWSMFGTPDHVSIANEKSFRALAEATGMKVVRIWTSEFPAETLLSLGVALRDARRGDGPPSHPAAGEGPGPGSQAVSGMQARARRLLKNPLFKPVAGILGACGLAGSIKAVMEKPSA